MTAAITGRHPTAMIADDEPLLRESLARLLSQTWPELEVIALARNGRAAVESFEAQHPDICFLDVHMPGLSGIEAARFIGRRAHVVFVTAYDQYAVQAFDQGALDYLVKPVELARLMDTVARLKQRLRSTPDIPDTGGLTRSARGAGFQAGSSPVLTRAALAARVGRAGTAPGVG